MRQYSVLITLMCVLFPLVFLYLFLLYNLFCVLLPSPLIFSCSRFLSAFTALRVSHTRQQRFTISVTLQSNGANRELGFEIPSQSLVSVRTAKN